MDIQFATEVKNMLSYKTFFNLQMLACTNVLLACNSINE